MFNSVLTKDQAKFFSKKVVLEGQPFEIELEIRYDDECNNGSNTFDITTTCYKLHEDGKKELESYGWEKECVKKYFPEFEKYLKWQLFTSEGPWYYITNTLYLAGDRDPYGRKKGEPESFSSKVKFATFPVMFSFSEKFTDSLKSCDIQKLEIFEVPHSSDDEKSKFGSRFTFSCFPCEWYECPFDSFASASQFLEAVKTIDFEIVKVPTSFSEGKEREFDEARSFALWPEATDEQLSLPPEELKQLLLDRLPGLIEEFKKDVEELGFVF